MERVRERIVELSDTVLERMDEVDGYGQGELERG